jgi:hypothetical protein
MFKSGYETNTCINHNRFSPGMNQGIDTGTRCPDQQAISKRKYMKSYLGGLLFGSYEGVVDPSWASLL